MKKLMLRVEDLRIDSFSTTPAARDAGTVFGEQCTCWTNCTCPGCPTCDESCNGTCDASCNGTCDVSCGGGCGTGWGEWTCDNSCDGGFTCDATCGGFATYPGPDQHCIIC
jgi:hypothetical protein